MTDKQERVEFPKAPGTFAWLDELARSRVLDKFRGINVDDHDWWDAVYEDAKTCGAILGIVVDDLHFSGFWSQGDGARIKGSYYHEVGATRNIRRHAPRDEKLRSIAKELTRLQKRYHYGLSAKIGFSGRYEHSGCTEIDVEHESREVDVDTYNALTEALRDFMNWIYSQLEKEYNYLTSDEAVIETIEANEYRFDEFGQLL